MSVEKNFQSASVWKGLSYEKRAELLRSCPTDCSFLVTSGGQTKRFNCHKWVLSNASEMFQSMFGGNFEESKDGIEVSVPIEDMEFTCFESFLEYIYYNENLVRGKHDIQYMIRIHNLADYYDVPELRLKCGEYIGGYFRNKMGCNFLNIVHAITYNESYFLNCKQSGCDLCDSGEIMSCLNRNLLRQNLGGYSFELISATTPIYDSKPFTFYKLIQIMCATMKNICGAPLITPYQCFIIIEMYAKSNALEMERPAWNTEDVRKSLPEGIVETNVNTKINKDASKVEEMKENALKTKIGKSAEENKAKKRKTIEAKVTLNKMFRLVKFEEMSPKEFACGPARSKIWNVSVEEKFEMLLALIENKS